MTFVFYGSGVKWIGLKGTDYGKAEIILDQEAPIIIDLYANPLVYRQVIYER